MTTVLQKIVRLHCQKLFFIQKTLNVPDNIF